MTFSFIKRVTRTIHQKVSQNNRIHKLAAELETKFRLLYKDAASIACLDVGCGDMQVSRLLHKQIPALSWTCIDIFPPESGRWPPEMSGRYQQYDGVSIPYCNNSFHVVMLVDVLHHCADIPGMLRETGRVAPCVLIKDHFEYGLYSRWVLRLIDFFGNWPYGGNVPKKYFTPAGFADICKDLGWEVVDLQVGIILYNHLPVVRRILRPEWQFTAVLRRNDPAPAGK